MWNPGKGLFVVDYTDDAVVQQNARINLVNGAFFSVMVGLTLPFMGVYAIHLGGGDYVVGLMTSLPALVAMISQVPSAVIVNRYSSKLQASLKWGLAQRLFYLAMALLALIPQDLPGRAMLLVIVFSLAHFPATVAGVAWTSLMGEMFPAQLRGRVFGDLQMLAGLVSLLATAAAGPFLDRVTFPANYFLLFLTSFACVMASWVCMARLREGDPAPGSCHHSRWHPRAMALLVRETLKVPEFASLTAATFVFHLGLHLPAALFTLLFVNTLRLSTSWIGAFSVISGVFSVATFRRWGTLADLRGSRYVLTLSMLVLVPLPIFYGLVHSPWPIVLLMAIGGVVGAGFGLTIFNALLDHSPAGNREDYIAVFNMLMGLSGFLMPVAGVALYHLWGFLEVFILASLVRAVGTWMLFQSARNCLPVCRDASTGRGGRSLPSNTG
jgi:MFS family permease